MVLEALILQTELRSPLALTYHPGTMECVGEVLQRGGKAANQRAQSSLVNCEVARVPEYERLSRGVFDTYVARPVRHWI